MKQEDAEKLAQRIAHSSIAPSNPNWISVGERVDIARKLAAHILSGDMKREIENAAYARVASLVERDKKVQGLARVHLAIRIRSLITPAKTADTEG